jgi:phage repressor protein C with HTH and peptisase S24 domain
MHGIGPRVIEARHRAGLTQAELAKQAGMTQQAVGEIEAGRSRKSVKTVVLAKALGVSAEWLETGRGSMAEPAREWRGPEVASDQRMLEIAGEEFARLPVYDIRFAAGAGSENYDEDPIDWHVISLSLLRGLTKAPLDQLAIFQAGGDSMEPTINNHDWVVVDRGRATLTNPGIYALLFEGEGLLKRAAQHLESREVTLISDNPKYPQQTIKKPERLTVVGRVFLSIRRH